MLQEFIPGHVETFVAVTAGTGEILSKHMQRTMREHGSESGISARATSVPMSGDFARQMQDFLTSINWFGLASIQFIQPERGAPALIDFNGRMYGSLVFANACGMRAMENWARMATGQDPAPTQEILGLRYQALEGDLRYAKKLRGWGRITEVAACLTEVGRSVHPILNWSDPRPTVHYLRRLRLRLAGQKLRAYEMTA
jgi:predicted ATP-grasp superfamily ATP-dependent carboligase